MNPPERVHRYYQSMADGYMIAGAQAVLHEMPDDSAFHNHLPADDRADLIEIARLYRRIIWRGPDQYQHVAEQTDVQGIWRQLAA